MLEWTLVVIFVSTTAALSYLCYNFAKTLNNIQARISDLREQVDDFDELVNTVNASETYYGDPIIQNLVTATTVLSETLKDVARIQEEIAGDAEEEN